MRNIKYFIFLIFFIGLISCRSNYLPMNEYQIVGFVPLSSAVFGRLFVIDNKLIVVYGNQHDAPIYEKIRKYELSNPINLELTDDIGLTETLPEILLSQYNKSLVFSLSDSDTIKVLDINSGRVFDINLGFRPLAIASKDSFMFTLADSTLSGWNITDFSNPVLIYRDSIPTGFTRGLLGISDTLMFGIFNNDSFKLWSIKLPSQPRIISSGVLDNEIPFKILLYDRNLFIAENIYWANSRIRHFTINDSGSLTLKNGSGADDQIQDFLIVRDTIYILMDDNRLMVSEISYLNIPFYMPFFWVEVPLPALVVHPNFVNYNNLIYIFARNKGIFIYKRTEAQ